jgi:hypothetical protein
MSRYEADLFDVAAGELRGHNSQLREFFGLQLLRVPEAHPSAAMRRNRASKRRLAASDRRAEQSLPSKHCAPSVLVRQLVADAEVETAD